MTNNYVGNMKSKYETEISNMQTHNTNYKTELENKRKITEVESGYILLKSYFSYKNNISLKRLINHFFVAISLSKQLLINSS